jgi:hypothetical protein
MLLSVVSALARMNIDPWEEATRLAAMPTASAEQTLVSTLALASDRSWGPSEAETIAARLVRLLPSPQRRGPTTATTTETAGTRGQRVFWIALLVLAIAMWLFWSQRATNTDAGTSPSTSSETTQMKSAGLIGTLSHSDGQSR